VKAWSIAFDPWSLVIAIVIYIIMSMSSCNEEEGKLAMKEGAGLCHTVGTWCSSCFRLFGKCVSCLEHSTGKCCFNSKLARIVNEQGRVQVGKGWGSGRKPRLLGLHHRATPEPRLCGHGPHRVLRLHRPDAAQCRRNPGQQCYARLTTCYYGQGKCQ
jgi:conjugal transfer mating pair stabilization protein TraN